MEMVSAETLPNVHPYLQLPTGHQLPVIMLDVA